MSISFTRPLATGLVVASGALAVLPALAAPALAGTAEAQVAINDCTVKQDRSKTFTFASCTVKSLAPAGQDVSVRYSSNLKAFRPKTGGTWSATTGTLRFSGGGSQLQAVKLAFKGKTPAQVRKGLKVTLSHAQGAQIGKATAVAAS